MAEAPVLEVKNLRVEFPTRRGTLVALDDISFSAPDRSGETIRIDASFVTKHVGDLAKNEDLSRFIL